jgi:hypothetical protein
MLVRNYWHLFLCQIIEKTPCFPLELSRLKPFKKERTKGRICQVFSGTLDYSAHICPRCASEEPAITIR